MLQENQPIEFIYGLEDNPGPTRGALYGLQHLLLMLAPTSLGPLILAGIVHLSSATTVLLVSATLIAAGVATLLQGQGVGRVGARLPVVQGTELFFIPPLAAIGLQYGLGSMAFLVGLGGLMVAVLSRLFPYVRRFFPALVIGTVITLIGVYLIPVGISLFLGQNTPFYGKGSAFAIGSITVILIVLFSYFFKGFWGSISILLGMAIAYILAIPFGMVNVKPIAQAAWVGLPHFFPFGLKVPGIPAIVVILVLFIVAAVEALGYIAATSELVGVPATSERIARGLAADGVGSFLSGILGAMPMTAYAQNLGALGMTRVGTRYVSLYAGGIIVLLGLIPKFGAALSTIPVPVLGGALLVLFGTVAGVGVQTLRNTLNTQRELLIFATSLALGVGFALAPSAGLAFMGSGVRVALQTGVAIGAVSVIVLNIIFPEQKAAVVASSGHTM